MESKLLKNFFQHPSEVSESDDRSISEGENSIAASISTIEYSSVESIGLQNSFKSHNQKQFEKKKNYEPPKHGKNYDEKVDSLFDYSAEEFKEMNNGTTKQKKQFEKHMSDVNLPVKIQSKTFSKLHSKQVVKRHSSQIVWQSVLMHLCSIYEPNDRERRQLLFWSICSSLEKLNLIESTYKIDELSTLRSHYSHAFVRLLKMAQSNIDHFQRPNSVGITFKENTNDLPMTNISGKLCNTDLNQMFYQHSRYANEFEELQYLAKGGFGCVYKCRNRLDNIEYAVKKIVLKLNGQKANMLFSKILREVTTLAMLTHPNIVCYKTAWLEPYISKTTSRTRFDYKSTNFNHFEINSTMSGDSRSVIQDNDSQGLSFNLESSKILRDKSNDIQNCSVSSNTGGVIFTKDDDVSDTSEGQFEVDSKKHSMPFKTKEYALDDSNSNILVSTFDSFASKNVKQELLYRAQNILSIKELDTEDEFDSSNEVQKVTGLAETPPNRSFRISHLSNQFTVEDMVDAGKFGVKPISKLSKFWHNGDSSSSTDQNVRPSNLLEEKNNKCRKQVKANCIDKNTENFDRINRNNYNCSNGYWSKNFLDEQTKKWETFLTKNSKELLEIENPNKFNSDKAVLYIQMQLCGNTLRHWLDERNTAKKPDSKIINQVDNDSIFRQILKGVQYIHSQNIVHRDLKPRNVFVSYINQAGEFQKGFHVQIGDFGLAKRDDLFGDSTVSVPTTPSALSDSLQYGFKGNWTLIRKAIGDLKVAPITD